MNPIYFYEEYKDYGYFSNYAACPIFLKGKLWPTTEHYYQAQKYAGTNQEEVVRQAPSPHNAKEMTRDPAHPPRGDWDAVKDEVMREAVLAQFTQHAHLEKLLLDTGAAVLAEHTANDSYWGDGGDGTGRNMLGQTLMAVRDLLRKSTAWRR